MSIARISLGHLSDLGPSATFATSGTVAAGDVVSQVSDADRTVQRADASNAAARPPIGIVQSVEGGRALVALNGEIASSLSGLTRGSTYWLDTTPGQLTATKPASNPYAVGVAVSATEIRIDTVAATILAGGGGVDSVGVSGDLTVSGSPVTTTGTINMTFPPGGILGLGQGGTGATDTATAFANIATSAFPTATLGTLIGHDGTEPLAITADAADKWLVADSSAPAGISWQDGGTVTSFGLTSSTLDVSGSPLTTSGTIDLNLPAYVGPVEGGTGLTTTSGEGATLVYNSGAYVSRRESLSWRNKILNPAMQIAQRGTGAVTTDGSYPVDRWVVRNTSASTFSCLSTAYGIMGGRAIQFSVTAVGAQSNAQVAGLNQNMEGTNVADLAWGTASAKTVTLSFFAQANNAGTYAVRVANSDGTRSYVTTYTIATANLMTRYAVTIPGDTTGTWQTGTGVGIQVFFDLGCGSDLAAPSADVWNAANYTRVSGCFSVVGTASANFLLGGVQLEAGTSPTQLEIRPSETELELCQRYFQRFSSLTGGTYAALGVGNASSTSAMWVWVKYAVPMRAQPTLSASTTGYYRTGIGSATAVGTVNYGDTSLGATINLSGNPLLGNNPVLWVTNGASGRLDLSAEI